MTRVLIFLAAFIGSFATVVLFNLPHLGANASLHWDASTCILTTDPMPDRATLLANQQHLVDLQQESGSTDPATVTRYFLQPENLSRHGPLETVRRYYSQVSYWLARGAFNIGADLTRSPTGAVIAFQLSAALSMSVTLALMMTYALMNLPRRAGRTFDAWIVVLVFMTIATEPVFLSLSRQMLTETAGFLMLVPAQMLFRAAIMPSRRTSVAVLLAALSAGFCFFTIRSRYTLGPTLLVLLVFLVLLTLPLATLRQRRRHYCFVGSAAIAMFVAFVALDMHYYGSFILPWVYDQALVRTTRLYFHTDPPYEPFWVMIYVNLPLLVVSIAGVFCWCVGRRETKSLPPPPAAVFQEILPRLYALVALLGLIAPIALMARQQVSFQPRHLFAFSAAYVSTLFLVLPFIRWRRTTAVPFIAMCFIVLIANLYSTFGPQRTTMAIPWPKTIAGILRDRTTAGPHPLLLHDLADGYFDWSDNDRVHDLLTVFAALPDDKSILIIDSKTPGAGAFGMFVTRFHQPYIWWDSATDQHAANTQKIQSAIKIGTPVFLVRPRDQPSPIQNALIKHLAKADLHGVTLYRVTGIAQTNGPNQALAWQAGTP